MSPLNPPDYTQDLNTQLQIAMVMGLTGNTEQQAQAKEWITAYIENNIPLVVQLLGLHGMKSKDRWPEVYAMGAALDWRKHLDMQRGLEELRLERAMLTERLKHVQDALCAYEVPVVETESSPASHPVFAHPSLLQPRLTREALLDRLRQRLNTGYMPSATGEVKYNRKPRYLSVKSSTESVFETWARLMDVGVFQREDTIAAGREELMVWLYDDTYHFLILLESLQVWIGSPSLAHPSPEWVLWPEGSTETLAINWTVLEEQIESYL